MIKNSIAFIVLAVLFIFSFLGCSENQTTKNIKENFTGKATGVVTALASANTDMPNKTPVNVVVKRSDVDEKVFVKPEEIKVFTNAIEIATPKGNIPPELKAPTYFVNFNYSDNKTVEYFLYLSQESGWIYKNGTEEAYTLSKDSIKDLKYLLSLFTENEAISKVIMEHPEFPDKAGIKEGEEKIGGPKENKASVKYETKVEKKGENFYTVIFTKTWGIKVGKKIPVSYWKYEVSPEKAVLVDKDEIGENLVGIIK